MSDHPEVRVRRGRPRIFPDVDCGQCGRPFRPHNRTQRMCSIACAAASRIGRPHPPRRNALTPRSCAQCGVTFKPELARIKFCSQPCYWAARTLPEDERITRRRASQAAWMERNRGPEPRTKRTAEVGSTYVDGGYIWVKTAPA